MPSSACKTHSPPSFSLFPYTTLFRSHPAVRRAVHRPAARTGDRRALHRPQPGAGGRSGPHAPASDRRRPRRLHALVAGARVPPRPRDRKSTRLNSSHLVISYAVFCLQNTLSSELFTLSLHDALPISSSRSTSCSSARRPDRRSPSVTSTAARCWRPVGSARPCFRPPAPSTTARTGRRRSSTTAPSRSEEHTSELQSPCNLVCRLLLAKHTLLRAFHSFPTRRSSDLIQPFDELFIGPPPGPAIAERYIDRSPVLAAGRVRTPLLQTAGALDDCTHWSQALEYHRALEIGRAHV